MRIYWINQYAVAPDMPGGTRHYDMGRHIAAAGHEVVLIASDLNLGTRRYFRRAEGDRRWIQERVSGVDFHWLHIPAYVGNNWRRAMSMAVFALRTLFHLLRMPMPKKATILVGSSPHLLAALTTQIAACLRRVPFILEVRDLWPETLVEITGRRGAQARLLRAIADHLYRTADAIVVLAEGNIEPIAARGIDRSKIRYIPNGIDASTFDIDIDETRPSPIPLPSGKFVAAYTGAHGPANGLDIAVTAAEILQRTGAFGIHLLMVGDGPAKAALQTRATALGLANITFAEPIPKAAIPALLARIDVGLHLLADVELFAYGVSPNKLFDYMAASLPVITNVRGMVGDLVEETACGLLIGSDAEALAEALTRLASDPELCAQLGPRGRAYVFAHHSRQSLATDFLQLCAHVALAGTPAPGGRHVSQ